MKTFTLTTKELETIPGYSTKHSRRARSAFLLITATAIAVTLAFAIWLMEVLKHA